MSIEKVRPKEIEEFPDGERRKTAIRDEVLRVVKHWRKEPSRIISGKRVIEVPPSTNGFIKCDRLDVDFGARWIFSCSVIPWAPYIFIAAREMFFSAPPAPNQAALITYEYTGKKHGLEPPDAARGRSWQKDWYEDNGEHGGNGADGTPGTAGITLQLPPVFLITNRIEIATGDPTSPRLMQFDFRGVAGGNGSRGGKGGDAGNGAKGTPAIDGFAECKAGPGPGGDAGRLGIGGRGGDAARGGNGADIYIIAPRSEEMKLRFSVLQEGGEAGMPGEPGAAGKPGIPGGGGSLSGECRNGNRDGSRPAAPNPINGGYGKSAADGAEGNYIVEYRDNADLF